MRRQKSISLFFFDVEQMDIFDIKGVGIICLLCIGTEPVVNDAEIFLVI